MYRGAFAAIHGWWCVLALMAGCAVPGVTDESELQFASLTTDADRQALICAGEANQAIEFNPNAAIQARIFADGYIPTSEEFRVTWSGITYGGQRAQAMWSNDVRVYFADTQNWAAISYYAYSPGDYNTGVKGFLIQAAEREHLLDLNPNAAIQNRILGDGFVPSSKEFTVRGCDGTVFVGQRGEALGSGAVRTYWIANGDAGTVYFADRLADWRNSCGTRCPGQQAPATSTPSASLVCGRDVGWTGDHATNPHSCVPIYDDSSQCWANTLDVGWYLMQNEGAHPSGGTSPSMVLRDYSRCVNGPGGCNGCIFREHYIIFEKSPGCVTYRKQRASEPNPNLYEYLAPAGSDNWWPAYVYWWHNSYC